MSSLYFVKIKWHLGLSLFCFVTCAPNRNNGLSILDDDVIFTIWTMNEVIEGLISQFSNKYLDKSLEASRQTNVVSISNMMPPIKTLETGVCFCYMASVPVWHNASFPFNSPNKQTFLVLSHSNMMPPISESLKPGFVLLHGVMNPYDTMQVSFFNKWWRTTLHQWSSRQYMFKYLQGPLVRRELENHAQ